jgi:signal transduction histidine kinase/CheY-like chemotaxis protein
VLPRHARYWPLLGWGLAVLWWCLPADSPSAQPWTDLQLRWLTQSPTGPLPLVVDIDEASLVELQPLVGTWPYGRDVHAAVVRWLRERGVAAIALDLVLADPHRGDDALAAEWMAAGAPLVLAAAGQNVPLSTAASPSAGAAARAGVADRKPAGGPAHVWPGMSLPLGRTTLGPATEARLGVITTPLDSDGVLRQLPLWHTAPGLPTPLPVMPLAMWQALDARSAGGAAVPRLPPRAVPDAQGRVALALGGWQRHGPDTPEIVPFVALASAALGAGPAPPWSESLRGRVVFVGSSALLGDRVMTPAGQREGTLVLAEAYVALRDGLSLPPRQRAWEALLLALAALPALLAARRGWASVRRDAASSAAVALLLAAAVAATLVVARLTLPTLAPLLALVLAGLGSVAWRQAALKAEASRAAYEQAVATATERTKSEFLANVSHEIRTPLNGLLGVAELLERTPLTAEQRRHVELFRDSGRSLKALIDDLLDLSRIEAGGFELHPAPFSPRRLLEQVQRLMQPRAAAKGLDFDLACDPALPAWLLGDRQRLEQVLLNLVGNAIKFTADGRVRLAARWAAEDGAAPRLELAVQDSGIGIAPSKHERVFEPFAQADGSITRHYGGTGLGLAIVRRLVGLMAGTIALDSAPGRGSTFTLRLPLPGVEAGALADADAAPPDIAPVPADASPADAPPADGAPPSAEPPRRVLLAEDNEVNVYIFCAMLAAPEFEVDIADNGLVALELARSRRYDIGFIDLMMPAMDGLTLAHELRRWESEGGRPRMPLVALTARAFDSDVAACLAAGFDRHVGKPFSRDTLLSAAHELAPAPEALPAVAPQTVPGLAVAVGGAAADPARAEHARHFMLHLEAEHAAALARGDAEQVRLLLRDLADVAAAVQAGELAAAAIAAAQAPSGPLSPDLRRALARALLQQGQRPPSIRPG